MFVIELENKQEEEHKEFYDKLSNISIEKEKMLNISIFSDEVSFAYKNIVKTEQDYNRIMEVTLSDINDYAVDAFLEYDVIYIFGFIIMMFTVLSFLDERKRGLWQIVHTCRNGRLKIVLNRLFILAWVAVITEIILVTWCNPTRGRVASVILVKIGRAHV